MLSPVAKKVIGVEIIEEAVEAAKENAALNGLDNCKFLAGDVLKVLDTIEEALVAGDSVRLIGFGTFETRSRKARTGRNPQKPDKVISIPASKAPVFKAGKSLKDAVNK